MTIFEVTEHKEEFQSNMTTKRIIMASIVKTQKTLLKWKKPIVRLKVWMRNRRRCEGT